MARYLIESPHTPAECLKALDAMLEKGAATLAKYDWGCMEGVHTGWTTVEAANESAARDTLPSSLRSKARIVKLNKFTPKEIESFHKK